MILNAILDVRVHDPEAMANVREQYGDARRTQIVPDEGEISLEDLIADEDVVITISGRGYIKRQPVATYRRQHRGGKGIIGHVTREEDAVEHLLVANTHDWALFFTNRGRVFSAKVHAIPDASTAAAEGVMMTGASNTKTFMTGIADSANRASVRIKS
jgi:DNA gyrase subunit A